MKYEKEETSSLFGIRSGKRVLLSRMIIMTLNRINADLRKVLNEFIQEIDSEVFYVPKAETLTAKDNITVKEQVCFNNLICK